MNNKSNVVVNGFESKKDFIVSVSTLYKNVLIVSDCYFVTLEHMTND